MTLGRWIALGILLLAAVVTFKSGFYSSSEYAALKRSETESRARLAELKVVNDSLAAYLDSLQTSPVVQERVARERLGMIRPGELVISVVPVKGDTARVGKGTEDK